MKNSANQIFNPSYTFQQDEKFEKLRIALGCKSTAFYILFQNYILTDRGYYFQYTDENVENFLAWSRHTPWLNKGNFSEFIKSAVKYGIFDSSLFETFGILTSQEIQYVWYTATKKHKVRYIVADYWLLPVRPVDNKESLTEKIRKSKVSGILCIKKEDIDYVENLILERVMHFEEEFKSTPRNQKSGELKVSYEQLLQNKRSQSIIFFQQVRACSFIFKDSSDEDIEKMFSIFCNRNILIKTAPDLEHKLFMQFINWLDNPSTPKLKKQ